MQRVLTCMTIGMVFTLVMSSASITADKVYTLKIADSFPIKHPMGEVVNHFMEAAKKESGGKLDFQYCPAQQLGKLHDLLKICQLGMTDIAYVGPTFFPGQLGLNTVVALPFWDSAKQGSAIYLELVKQSKEIQKEWADNRVRPLFVSATSQYEVGTGTKQVVRISDLSGLRMKTPGGIFDNIAKRYGIVPVAMSFNEAYEAIQRNIIDGAVQTLPSVKGYRLFEVEKHHVAGLRMGGYISTYVINDKALRKLPEDVKQTLFRAGESATVFAAELLDTMNASLVRTFEDQGMQFFNIPEDKKPEWLAPLKGIEEEWIAEYGKKGKPARAVYEHFRKIAEKVVGQ